jgi:hypothetical protein
MKTLQVAFLGFTLLGSVALKAQTADDIIAKHIEAIGGKEKISGLKSIYKEESVQVMGNEAPSTTYIVDGKGFKSEVEFGGQKIVQCFSENGAWGLNPMAGQSSPEPYSDEIAKMSKGQYDIVGALYNYSAKGNKVELQGNEDVNGVPCYKLKVLTPENVETIYFIDSKTYYGVKRISKINMAGQEAEAGITYSDFRKTDYGYIMPFSTEIALPQGFNLTSITKKVEINKPIDMKIFEMPK